LAWVRWSRNMLAAIGAGMAALYLGLWAGF
jgi:hypothetical protein